MVSQMDALLTHLGTGRWSILHFIAMAYSSVLLAPHALGGAFLAPRLDYSCRVSSGSTSTASNLSILQEANSSSTFPSDSSTAEGKCEYWIDTPDGGKIEECVDFDFDNSTFSSTFTSEYNLACGRGYLQISFQSLYMFGTLVGALVNGYLTDRYGRKRIVILGYISYVVLSVTSAWLPFLSSILVARFLLGCLHVVVGCTSYVLSLEVLVPKMRTLASFGAYNIWAVVMMVYGGLGYLIRDWRILQTVMSLPGLLVLPALWYIDESPRWLIVNGRTQEAIQVLGKIARWHGVQLPPQIKSLIEDEASLVQDTHQHSSAWVIIKSVVSEFLVLFRTPRLRIITLCIFFNFLMMGMIYYGLSISGANISDDPYLYMVLMGLMEIPAYSLTGSVVERFGRKPTASMSFFIASVVLILAVILKVYKTTVVVLAMIGKVAITGGYQAITFFAGELFPTEVRSRGISSSFIISRIGGILSIFITDLMGSVYPWAPFIVFGSGALLAAALVIVLPETRGQTLPDTVAEMEARLSEGPDRKRRIVMTLGNRV